MFFSVFFIFHWSHYLKTPRDSVSPVRGIFLLLSFGGQSQKNHHQSEVSAETKTQTTPFSHPSHLVYSECDSERHHPSIIQEEQHQDEVPGVKHLRLSKLPYNNNNKRCIVSDIACTIVRVQTKVH